MNPTSMRRLSAAALYGLALAMAPAVAGTIVVSGDMTPVFALTDTAPNLAVAGNRTLFSNLLGSGDGVLILATGNNAFASPELDEFYSLLPGVSASVLDGAINPAVLAGIELVVAPSPSRAFNATEVAALSGFLQSGGTLLVMGEAQVIPFGAATNLFLNGLLGDLGSTMLLQNASLDTGASTASGDRIVAGPYTAGVESFAYGAASRVLGGMPMFRSSGGETFMAYEASVVPEPATVLSLTAGLALLGLVLRRRR